MSDPLLTEALKMAQHECFHILVPQWHARLIVIIGGTYEQHLEIFRKRRVGKEEALDLANYLKSEMKHNAAVVLQPNTRPRAQFVYFPKRPSLTSPVTVGTIAHELLHVTVGILTKSDVRLTAASEEAFTYLHGHLMQEFWKRLS